MRSTRSLNKIYDPTAWCPTHNIYISSYRALDFYDFNVSADSTSNWTHISFKMVMIWRESWNLRRAVHLNSPIARGRQSRNAIRRWRQLLVMGRDCISKFYVGKFSVGSGFNDNFMSYQFLVAVLIALVSMHHEVVAGRRERHRRLNKFLSHICLLSNRRLSLHVSNNFLRGILSSPAAKERRIENSDWGWWARDGIKMNLNTREMRKPFNIPHRASPSVLLRADWKEKCFCAGPLELRVNKHFIWILFWNKRNLH